MINLEDCVCIHAALYHKKYKHVFDIQTKDRIYYLVAVSAEEMMSWVQAVCKLCNFSTSDKHCGFKEREREREGGREGGREREREREKEKERERERS